MVDDKQLVQAAQAGNREAIGALFAAYHPPIYRYIAYRVGDQQLADDLTGEVFVTMVKKLPTYEERGRPFLAWLYTIASNTVKMHYRQTTKRTIEPLAEELIDPRANPLEATAARLNQRRLLQALPQLSEPQQEVIVLKFIEGLSTAEVAAFLGKTEGAIRILQHRALQALRQLLHVDEEVSHGSA